MATSISNVSLDDRSQKISLGILAALTAALAVAYLDTLSITFEFWTKPEYSHGYLVPAFALVLLWLRYEPFTPVPMAERWWGVAIVAGSLLLRMSVAFFSLIIPDMVTLIPALLGIFVIVGGWRALRWSWPAILFLVFMFPLPDALERGLLAPLQKFATMASTHVLQTLGLGAYREGNRIIIGELQMGVVDACAGLRMLTIFFALCTAITMVVAMPIWQRVVIILSAIPIALLVNIIRISVTGVLYVTTSEEVAEKVFHDLAGWVMMPMALGLLYCEYQILNHLFIEEEAPAPIELGSRGTRPRTSPI